ncbi:MAG TPA: ATP-binding protein [Gemmatimonadales bacterium]|nr:ATP-binding protein [Gemmatimonadales bacterium]
MKGSLRRTLAIRFAATMAAGLILATGAFYWSASRALQEPVPPAVLRFDLLLVLIAIVVAGTAATLMGAWHFTSSAVRPVSEITAQATRIEAGTLNQRILAHAETEEYEGLVAVLNRMLERLERGFAAQRRLTADVGHELRTPLTAMRGAIEVALRAPRSQSEYERVLRGELEEIDRLTEMSEDLLLITRADSGAVSASPTVTDLSPLVGDILDRLQRRFEERGLSVERALPASRFASVDPGLVRRVIDHLIDNAIRYTPEGGTIRVALDALGDGGARLAVENTGPGIAAGDLAHLFEPFYRTDPARTRSQDGGTGLGLALVASIARLHGGQARVSSVPGRTRFEVDFPA